MSVRVKFVEWLIGVLMAVSCCWGVRGADPVAWDYSGWPPHEPHEGRRHDPPAPPRPRVTSPALPPEALRRDSFQSVQVNVDAAGNNIVGDAANEPTLAIDPTNPNHLTIVWRQFDSVTSNFRQAGWAYSRDGGRTWTFPGVIEPGVFRSDPVLSTTAEGQLQLMSLAQDFSCQTFKSIAGGATWTGPRDAVGGDKPWIEIDRTAGIGHGNIYCTWGGYFTRSLDGGQTWPLYRAITGKPAYGTVTVGPDGEVYVVGKAWDANTMRIARSSNAQDGSGNWGFQLAKQINLGGLLRLGWTGPNPEGLYGQAWVACDHSSGPTRGNVYVLCSVTGADSDPLDVMFIRSTDQGQTWSTPLRINDDPTTTNAWQWFGTMSVAPNGRIDAIWNDTRNSSDYRWSEVYYSCSTDGGLTWTPNVPITPAFNSQVGYPQQQKLGDYYHMISDNAGANLAYAATFNGEQDVYFVRIGPYDCNNNGVADETDIANGTSLDLDGNRVPDECEDCNGNGVPDGMELSNGTNVDCNNNARLDDCDIASGASPDVNGNGIPDECELDCNENSIPDAWDIAIGTSQDCNANAIPDECDLADGTSVDCNSNGIPDSCDVASGASADCDANGVPDECQSDCNGNGVADPCDLASGTSPDCNQNAVPDECEPGGTQDCNQNSVPDLCDIYAGTSPDCNLNYVPDECDLAAGTSGDANGDGIPDECALCRASRATKLYSGGASGSTGWARALALSADLLVVGAEGDYGSGTWKGAAFVLRMHSGRWKFETRLAAPVSGDGFGHAVAACGDTLLVGAPAKTPQNSTGAAYVFRHMDAGWVQEAELTPSGNYGAIGFGSAVALSADVALIGAPSADYQGAAFVFRRQGSTWSFEQKLSASDAVSYEQFGFAVALTPTQAMVGVPYRADNGYNSGAAYVFQCDGNTWTQTQKLYPPDPVERAWFGYCIAMSSGRALIGAATDGGVNGASGSGSAYMLRYDEPNWVFEAKLLPPGAAYLDMFGISVALAEDTAVVGAYGTDDGGMNAGSAFLYRRFGSGWVNAARLAAADEAAGNAFGASVAVGSGVAAVGASGYTAGGDNSGSLYLFGAIADCNGNGALDLCELEAGTAADCNANGVLDECDITAGTSPDMDLNGVPDECAGSKGDLNCDGVVNNQDIDHFIQAIIDSAAYVADHDGDPYPPCEILNGDFNFDGVVNNQDIDGFATALFRD